MGVRDFFAVLKESAWDFMEDRCMRLAAALAYYTAFSLPPLLILVVMLLGTVVEPATVEDEISQQTRSVVGAEGADQIATMLESARETGFTTLSGLIGIGALLFGATAVMIALQDALNTVWQVKPDPNQGGIKNFLLKRVVSFAMVLGIAFLLLVSLIITAAITAMGRVASENFQGDYWSSIFQIVNSVASILVITLLFAAMFRYVPDARVAWRDVWMGAGITALLFTAGKLALGLYLGRRDLSSVYGAAGSLALILVWVYYTSMILFFGAEFTQAWARKRGNRIQPEEGAVRVVEKTVSGAEAMHDSHAR